ncbi:DUF222 domain-containing protein, partial [Actinomadura darangshiensis]
MPPVSATTGLLVPAAKVRHEVGGHVSRCVGVVVRAESPGTPTLRTRGYADRGSSSESLNSGSCVTEGFRRDGSRGDVHDLLCSNSVAGRHLKKIEERCDDGATCLDRRVFRVQIWRRIGGVGMDWGWGVRTVSMPIAVDDHQHEWDWEERARFQLGPPPSVHMPKQSGRLCNLADDELLDVARAARRRASWAQARELAAIAELHRRRIDAESDDDPGYRILSARESVTEEVAAALTVTSNVAATLVHLAERLTGPLAATGAALEAGRIDLAKARVICDATDDLPEQATQRVEAAALEKASDQTTGQLRRRLKRIAQRLAPEVIEERKREAVRRRRLELWENPSGTADLALCDLAAEDAHAIYNKITAAAHGLKADGDTRPLTTIRAD